MKKIIVTTSWDDGNKLDLKLADLLEKYKLKGTFYISPGSKKFSLSKEEIKKLSQSQEVGAHTVSHPRLTQITGAEAKKEISESKDYLEKLLSREVKMFCYPYGKFSQDIKSLVREAGFSGARTVERFKTHLPNDPFEFGTTLQIYPLKFDRIRQDFWSFLKLPPNVFFSWESLAKTLFDRVSKNGGMYHLWGHSWEIEKYDLWGNLEEVFKYISRRDGVFYLTNGQVLENL